MTGNRRDLEWTNLVGDISDRKHPGPYPTNLGSVKLNIHSKGWENYFLFSPQECPKDSGTKIKSSSLILTYNQNPSLGFEFTWGATESFCNIKSQTEQLDFNEVFLILVRDQKKKAVSLQH